MGTTKTLMTCLLAVILAASLSNQNVLVSGRSTIANSVEIAVPSLSVYGTDSKVLLVL